MDTYLKELVNKTSSLLLLSKEINSHLENEFSDDFLYMCKVFTCRQISHMESIVRLKELDNIILISRSMFEGLVYLGYSDKNKEKARKWRMFSVLLDIQRAKEETPPDDVKTYFKAIKKRLINSLKKIMVHI